MMDSTRKWYIPLFLLLITAFVPWWQEVKRIEERTDKARLAYAPSYSEEKLRSEHKWFVSYTRMNGQTLASPAEYWSFLDRKTMLEDALLRKVKTTENPERIEWSSRLSQMTIGDNTLQIMNRFSEKFGERAMIETKPKDLYFDKKMKISVQGDGFAEFVQGYLWSIPVMFLVFCVRLRVRRLLIWPELWRLVPASIVWPIGLVIYPRDVRREEQLKSAMYFIAQLCSALVGIFGFGPVLTTIAKAQPSKAKSGSEQTNKKSSGSFGYGLELYPKTSGIDRGLIASPWYSWSAPLPKGVNLSGFGFVEAGERSSQLFTNHALNVSHGRMYGLMGTVELGGTTSGEFVQVGPRINLVKLPFFPSGGKKVAKSVVAGSFWRIRGPTKYQEYFLGWASRELALPSGWKLSTEGFMRFRPGPRPAVGQPQLILRHPKIPHTQFVSEFWMIGTQPTIRLGMQFSK